MTKFHGAAPGYIVKNIITIILIFFILISVSTDFLACLQPLNIYTNNFFINTRNKFNNPDIISDCSILDVCFVKRASYINRQHIAFMSIDNWHTAASAGPLCAYSPY